MESTLATINRIAALIPSKIRGVIYSLLGLFWMVEAIWDIIPNDETGSKIAATLTLLGTIMAVVNTDLVPDPRKPTTTDQQLEDQRTDSGESTLMTVFLIVAIVVLVLFGLSYLR